MYLNSSDSRIPLCAGDIVEISPSKRFVIDKFIASGGFCLMYLAHQEGTARYVALKELYPRRVEDAFVERMEDGHILVWNPFSEFDEETDISLQEEFTRYLEREVVLTKKAGSVYTNGGFLDQQNNLDVLQAEGPMTDTHGNIYIAIDTYQGESLREYIERGFLKDTQGKVLSNRYIEEVIHILLETTLRLSNLHDNEQILHLDLSPDNIYLAHAAGKTRLEPYIIDYGSAYDKANSTEEVDHRYTCNPYSAPEILSLSELQDRTGYYYADASSDTYAIASILFYAATGLIFKPEMRTFTKNWKNQIIRAYSSGLSKELSSDTFAACLIHFFEKGLTANQQGRFGDCKSLLDALKLLTEKYKQYGNLLPLIPRDELMSYMLMERYPLYHYRSGDGQIHIVCLGSGKFIQRMILSMISCGQIINSQLHIHVFSNEKKEVFQDQMLQTAPMLEKFSNICYPVEDEYVSFYYRQVSDVLDQEVCRTILEENGNYFLISLGKNSENIAAAELYAREMVEKYGEIHSATVINYYCSEDAANTTRFFNTDKKNPGWLEVDAFADDLMSYTEVQHTLGLRTIRLAHLYNKEDNQRISLEETANRIAKSEYDQRASCASAIHLKYKLAGIGVDPETVQQEVISQYCAALNKDLYHKLLKNEHDRWMMSMIADGYVEPNMMELRQYGFEMVNGSFNSAWKSKALHFHPCLVPCDENGIRLRGESWELYDTIEKISESDFDPLDRVSLKLHILAKEKCDKILQRDIIGRAFQDIENKLTDAGNEFPWETSEEIVNPMHPLHIYKEQLDMLRKSICGSVVKRNTIPDIEQLAIFQNQLESIGINISEEISILQQKLMVFREYAEFKDYKKWDDKIIRNLLWILYADTHISMVKLVGKKVADNVIGPLVLEPERLFYYGSEEQSTWVSFLRNHGYRGEIRFMPSRECSAEQICMDLEQIIYSEEHCIIDITNADENAVLAAKQLCEITGNAGIIRTTEKGAIENMYQFAEAPIYRFNTVIYADEIYRLYGAQRKTDGPDYMEQVQNYIPALWKLYRKFRKDWNMISAFFSYAVAKQSEVHINGIYIGEGTRWNCYEWTVVNDKWKALKLDQVFLKLHAAGIIRELKVLGQGKETSKLTFFYPDDGKNDYFKFALNQFFLHKWRDAFAPFTCKITGTADYGYTVDIKSGYNVDLLAKNLTFTEKQKTNQIPQQYNFSLIFPVLKCMKEEGLIDNLKLPEEPLVTPFNISFYFTNLSIRDCLTVSGSILELYIWYEAKRTHFFNDVQTNYAFVWNDNYTKNELDVIVTYGTTSLVISAKTSKFNKEHLYEIQSLTDQFSLNSKAVIIYSSAEAFENGRITDDLLPVKKRAKAMNVYLIDLNELEKQGATLGEKLMRIVTEKDKP